MGIHAAGGSLAGSRRKYQHKLVKRGLGKRKKRESQQQRMTTAAGLLTSVVLQ